MFFEIIILSLIISIIKGGKISNIVSVEFKHPVIILLGVGLQVVGIFLQNTYNPLFIKYLSYVNIISYLIFIIGLSYNSNLKGFKFLSMGGLLNFLPILVNGGKMPVSLKALRIINNESQIELLLNNRVLTHSLANKATRLKFLIDFIPLGKPYIFPKVISIGDVFFSLGIFIFIYYYSKTEEGDYEE